MSAYVMNVSLCHEYVSLCHEYVSLCHEWQLMS
jgi:hypothetical protein